MQLANLLCSLRQKLLTAWNTNNQQELADLMTAFSVMREASYPLQDSQLTVIMVALEDATRDALGGFQSKGEIPSVEQIQAACQS